MIWGYHYFRIHPVGGFSPTHLKNMLVKLEILPNFRGENKDVWIHRLAWYCCSGGRLKKDKLCFVVFGESKFKIWIIVTSERLQASHSFFLQFRSPTTAVLEDWCWMAESGNSPIFCVCKMANEEVLWLPDVSVSSMVSFVVVHGSTKHQSTLIQYKLDLAVSLREGTVFPTEH